MNESIVKHIKTLFPGQDFIPLHEPKFIGNEKEYLSKCIDSTFVSTVGEYVGIFEDQIKELTGAKYAIGLVNGTQALHVALLALGVNGDDEVITQSLTFIATANAISYTSAKPIFLDVDKANMGLSPESVYAFLKENVELKNGEAFNKNTNKRIAACVPMHTFGHSCRIDEIVKLCNAYNIPVIEDAAESLASYYKGQHTGTYGKAGVFSFNGNKIITCGGGGMLITDDEQLYERVKHLSSTAKIPHKWEYVHDEIGYNFRLPSINSALASAQMEQLDFYVQSKTGLAKLYKEYFKSIDGVDFFHEPMNCTSNHWLNAIIFENKTKRDEFLEYSNNNGVMTRPIWNLMNEMPMYSDCETDKLENATWLSERVVNIPSSVRT